MLIRMHTLFDSVFGLLVDRPQPAGHARRQADGCGPPPGGLGFISKSRILNAYLKQLGKIQQ